MIEINFYPFEFLEHYALITHYIYNYFIENIYQFLGVFFSIVYVVFSIRENILCWPALIIAAIFNMFAYHIIELPLQVIMQLFFIGTGIYGWHNWKRGEDTGILKIKSWSMQKHTQWVILGLAATMIFWFFLTIKSDNLLITISSSSPFLDSLMFIFNLIPMYMTSRKILESWIYFICIDIISGIFYLYTGEFFFCFLFFCYIGFAIYGYRTWKKNTI